MYKTFNEFTNILENALLPPVLKNPKKVQIKLKECDQQANYTNIIDLNSLVNKSKLYYYYVNNYILMYLL